MAGIRLFHPRDLDALYEVSTATGLGGGDASQLYADPKLIGHIYSAPYGTLEPSLAVVAEDDRGVAGFVVGTLDTEAWERRLEREWWPKLRRGYEDPIRTAADRRTPDQKRAFMIHHPERTPRRVTREFPAHLHMNLLPRLQRRGIGSQMLDRWLAIALRRRARAFHVRTNRANAGAVMFWNKKGFKAIAPYGDAIAGPLWMGMSLPR